jgi:hypothetical protein
MWGQGKLNDYGRAALVEQLQNIFDTKKAAYLRQNEFFRQQAVEMGLNPDRVVPNYLSDEGATPSVSKKYD